MARPRGVTLLVAFFAFGAAMCGLTIALLLAPGTALDALWLVKPDAHDGLNALGPWAVAIMLATASGCAAAALGLARGREWGRRTAIAVLVINMGGDTVSALARHDWRALLGLPIGGAMVLYLCGRPMREWIAQSTR